MGTKIKHVLKKIRIRRTTVLIIAFIVMSCILINRLFYLQIIQGENYVNNFSLRTTKTRTVKSTRGNIFDRNGETLAYNELSYSVTIEDNGTYDTTREKNLVINGTAYRLMQILESNGDSLDTSFHIKMDETGNYAFDVEEGVTLDRFRADIYGRALVEDMEKDEATATAEEMMAYLSGDERFSIVLYGDNAYTEQELSGHGLPLELSREDVLNISIIRYMLSTNSFQKYMPVTIATNVSDESVAAIMENQNELQGIDVIEDSIRHYEEHESLGPILGYTGRASSEELENLKKENPDYASDSIIGKAGIEQYMETTLQGTDGEETVYVDNLGKVLQIDESSKVEPVAGDDVYLTIDKNWQEAIYQILEQRVAGILISKIDNAKTFDKTAITDASQIRIPIYDVYNALIQNSVIDISHFEQTDASSTEKNLYAKFQQKQQEVFGRISEELTGDGNTAYKDQDEEMQEYLSYITEELLQDKLEILPSNVIDTSDETYLAWTEEKNISLKQYLTYATGQNWIDISKFSPEGDYLDSQEIYLALADYMIEYLQTDTDFSKLLYKYMLLNDTISGSELCLVLYDQGILSKDDGMYEGLAQGSTAAYDFMISKINSLEITPAQLALDPCSASAVITDVNSGDVLACVTYPGYDNNRLANKMDTDYYSKLSTDLSSPFFNKATQQRTAPGSTFKLVSAIAGFKEGIVTDGTYIDCDGLFDLAGYHINCWNKSGHGSLEIRGAIEQSCNVFFDTIGFNLGMTGEDTYSETQSINMLQKYSEMVNLDKKTGIELTESEPHVSDQMAIPSYMGQGTHLYTTSQLARYAATLANSGTSYKLTLLDKVTNPQGEITQENGTEAIGQVEMEKGQWADIHDGMYRVVQTHAEFSGLGLAVAGKTGTAQEAEDRPDHGLFIGYAPYDSPEVALAVRIPNGYSSGNACLAANDILKYIFRLADEDEILTGYASANSSDTSND